VSCRATHAQFTGFTGTKVQILTLKARTNAREPAQKLMGVQQELNQAKAAQFKVMSEAKSKVGVFSMYAVQEARDLFWGSMGQGKVASW